MGRILLVGGTVGGVSNSYDVLDLFHYSAPGRHDLSGSVAGYFSADNGATNLHNFNVSVLGGDRGDWVSSSTPDAFDAFGSPGMVAAVSSSDLTALDAIGWNVASVAPSPALPDLTVSSLTIDSTGNSVSFTLNNIGIVGASSPMANIYLSTDSTVTTADTFLSSVTAPSLAAGTSIMISNVSIPLAAPASAGTYYLGVVADPGGTIPEASESNNVSNVVPVILGTVGNNSLTGTSGNELINGFDGNDTIIGNGGSDILIGGRGADHFRYNATTDGGDTIVDFTPNVDVLDFSRAAFGNHLALNGANIGILSASHFAANFDGHATSATPQFIYNTTMHTLFFDGDGTGGTAPVPIALLGNAPLLTNSDFHLV